MTGRALVRARYVGGPADGRVDEFSPAPGEALDVRCVPVVPTVDLAALDVPDFYPPQVAEYLLVHGDALSVGEPEALLRDVRPGLHIVSAVYEFRRLR